MSKKEIVMNRMATVRKLASGIWQLDCQVGGKRYRKSLGAGSKNWAKAEADRVLFDMVEGPARRYSTVTFDVLGEMWVKYSTCGAAKRGRLRETTVTDNMSALLSVARAVGLESSDLVEKLTPEKVREWHRGAVAKLGALDEVEEGRKVKSLYSKWNKAKSVVGRWAIQFYEDIGAKGLRPWAVSLREVVLPVGYVESYSVPPGELVERTEIEGNALKAVNMPLWAVYKLAINLGLRSSEMVALRPEWAERSHGKLVIAVIRRSDFRPKGTSRRIPVPESLWAELLEFQKAHGGEFILPGTKTARDNLIGREFAGWMRSIGWDAERYPKAAHELRKLFGSRVYSDPALGPAYAQEYLGHGSVSTTCRFYAALDRVPVAMPER
jgi:integrase